MTERASVPMQKDLLTKRWRMVRRIEPTELQIHISLVERLRLQAPPEVLWWHCPNGELRPDKAGAKLKAMGVRPGVADLAFIWTPGFSASPCVLFLELKSHKGRLGVNQLSFRNAALAAGASYEQANTIDEAVAILVKYGILPAENRGDSQS